MRTKYKPWTKEYLELHTEVQLPLESLKELDDFYLEIGSGKGQFLLDMSKKFLDKTFIGVERNQTCAGFTAKKLVDNEINNGKIIYDNADFVLLNILDKSVNTIFLNFSDPWPKKRHEKRRLTFGSYLYSYARILKEDGKLIFKTDNADLFAFTLESVQDSPFIILQKNENYQGDDDFDAQSEYEMSFRELGQPIYRLILKKK